MFRRLAAAALLVATAAAAPAQELQPLDGWVIHATPHDYATLVDRVDAAVEASPLNVVTRASATVGAEAIGETIPGNMVVGVYAAPFAVRMLDASVQAGIEAPLRLYLTENDDGTATLSYRTASFVFAPYDDGGGALDELAAELDGILEQIAAAATAD
ncbi:MAG: DUF302 domain-containing protein [Alphaproteobacteria bacterium]|jgi:uncharacterized protein (DUF302 family)|nr:DUF302 domain-containing protein [Alphaproteobacteria bacterium]